MIRGSVNSRHEIIFRITIFDSNGNTLETESLLDTGFDGSLTLSPEAIAQLGLPRRTRSSATLADGTVEEFDVHSAIIIWDGLPRSIMVQAIDATPLLGMALLVGFDLQVRVLEGGQALIAAVP